jgi:hypothetical protein
MLVLFASLNAMDGICCPDGCTHEPQSLSQQHTPGPADGICMLCLGGVDSSVRQDLSPCAVIADSVGLPPFEHPLDALMEPVEHPPRG